MEDNSNLERYYLAFHQFLTIVTSTEEIKFLILLLEKEKKEVNVFFRIIIDELKYSRKSAYDIFKKLKKKKLIEKVEICPYCNKIYKDENIPPICKYCERQLISENIMFKSKRDYPRYFIRLTEEKKKLVLDFIQFFAEFCKWLEQ